MNVLMDAGQHFSYAGDIVFMYFPFPHILFDNIFVLVLGFFFCSAGRSEC